jgi:hypothetical protein
MLHHLSHFPFQIPRNIRRPDPKENSVLDGLNIQSIHELSLFLYERILRLPYDQVHLQWEISQYLILAMHLAALVVAHLTLHHDVE